MNSGFNLLSVRGVPSSSTTCSIQASEWRKTKRAQSFCCGRFKSCQGTVRARTVLLSGEVKPREIGLNEFCLFYLLRFPVFCFHERVGQLLERESQSELLFRGFSRSQSPEVHSQLSSNGNDCFFSCGCGRCCLEENLIPAFYRVIVRLVA